MTSMAEAIETTRRFAPGLPEFLAEQDLMTMESGDVDLAALLRSHKLCGLVIPKQFGGRGASVAEAIQVQRYMGARAPSMALMATMHGFSCSFLSLFGVFDETGAAILRQICAQQLLVASGFAEGRPGAGLFEYQTTAKKVEGGYALNGRKRPLTLAREMDILTLGFVSEGGSGQPQTGLALVQAGVQGMQVRPFWNSPVLRAAGSHEVVLEHVVVPEDTIFLSDESDEESIAQMRTLEFLGISCFQLFVAASYLGVATALAERLVQRGRASSSDMAEIWTELEGSMATLDSCARHLEETSAPTASDMAKAMIARFSTQKAIRRASHLTVELLGGNAFFSEPTVGYLANAVGCLAYHPMSRRQADDIIASAAYPQA